MLPIAYPKVVSDLRWWLVQVDNIGHEALLRREAYKKISQMSTCEIFLYFRCVFGPNNKGEGLFRDLNLKSTPLSYMSPVSSMIG